MSIAKWSPTPSDERGKGRYARGRPSLDRRVDVGRSMDAGIFDLGGGSTSDSGAMYYIASFHK